ncbi:hypothetical protein [Peribacillus muralis]|uniref:hypothetical protein n=1 Tax=Peribacillus muralis TaxID=264697 RepID=UPI00128EEC6F|nr:hypothetical protein [Peribacillus muralis]
MNRLTGGQAKAQLRAKKVLVTLVTSISSATSSEQSPSSRTFCRTPIKISINVCGDARLVSFHYKYQSLKGWLRIGIPTCSLGYSSKVQMSEQPGIGKKKKRPDKDPLLFHLLQCRVQGFYIFFH